MPEPLTKVEFSNLDKILYPRKKVTKAQVIEYFIKVAPKMLEFLTDRPLVMTRYPDGIEKEGFYEKDKPVGTPTWVKTFRKYSESARRSLDYVVCDNLDTLLWLANLAALEIHMTLSRVSSFDKPDLMLFDVDPEPPATFDDAVLAADALIQVLDDLKLKSYVKTSGKKGLHIVVPIIDKYTFRQTREFAHQIGKRVSSKSDLIVSEFSESRKKGTVFIDYLQNAHGKTMICPYSLRATPQATVSKPLPWSAIKKGLKPEDSTVFNVAETKENPWKGIFENQQDLEAHLSG